MPAPGPDVLSRAHRAVVVAFLLHGLASASWFVRIPDLRDRADLGDGGLGLVLAALGVGAILAMPVAGTVVGRIGSAPAMRLTLPLVAVALALAAQAGAPVTLALGAFALGAALGVHDIAMNTHAVTVERAAGRPILSGVHAAFSIGGLLGAGVGALATALDVAPRVHLLATAVAIAAGLLAYRALLPAEADRAPARQAHAPRPTLLEALEPLRHGWLLACAVVALASFVAENAVAEWSGVLLRDHRGASPAVAALAFFVFSAAMTVGRLTGDRTVARLGDRRTLLLGGVGAGLAWATVALVDVTWVAMAAWVVAGLALANAVPVVFRAAGSGRPGRSGRPGPSAAQGLSVVSGLGYAGGLVGPAVVGGAAELADLPHALLIPAALAACIALLSGAAAGRTRGD
jgi:predicted MFS family arabinose efflux permease